MKISQPSNNNEDAKKLINDYYQRESSFGHLPEVKQNKGGKGTQQHFSQPNTISSLSNNYPYPQKPPNMHYATSRDVATLNFSPAPRKMPYHRKNLSTLSKLKG